MKRENVFKLAGEVKAVDATNNRIMVETVNLDRAGKSHTDMHLIYMDKIGKGIKPGKFVMVGGELSSEGFDCRLKAEVVKVLAEKQYINKAQVEGELNRRVRYFPPSQGKIGFGNLTVRIGDGDNARYVSGVAYRQLAGELGANGLKGALIRLVGRLGMRTFRDANGNDRYTSEIHADEGQTTILRPPAEKEDTFSDLLPVEENKSKLEALLGMIGGSMPKADEPEPEAF